MIVISLRPGYDKLGGQITGLKVKKVGEMSLNSTRAMLTVGKLRFHFFSLDLIVAFIFKIDRSVFSRRKTSML